MSHKGQKIKSDNETFKILHVLKNGDSQEDIMDKFHEKLNVRIYGMGHDGNIVIAVKT